MNKRGEESTTTSYEVIMGIVIATLLVVIAFSFVTSSGTANTSFLPAYVRDIGNIMEGMASTSGDVSVVYSFKDDLNIGYVDSKVSLGDGGGIASRRVYLPKDITVTVKKVDFTSKHVLIHKKGKSITLAMVDQKIDVPTGVNQKVFGVTSDCGDKQEEISIKTDISDIADLERSFPQSSTATKLFVEKQEFVSLHKNEVIIYYNETKKLDDFFCRLEYELTFDLDIIPVFIPTTQPELLDSYDVVLSFSEFQYVPSQLKKIFETARGAARG